MVVAMRVAPESRICVRSMPWPTRSANLPLVAHRAGVLAIDSYAMQTTRTRAQKSGLTNLALTFVLPHEHAPMRLPVVPAALTALLSGMAETTIPVSDTTARRAFLCRDPCYPLWIERSCNSIGCSIAALTFGLSTGLSNRSIPTPAFDSVRTFWGSGGTIDGKAADYAMLGNTTVLGRGEGNPSIFIPPNSQFTLVLDAGSVPATGNLEAELVWFQGEDQFTTTVRMDISGSTFTYAGPAGGFVPTTGYLMEGLTPVGFTYLRAFRYGTVTLTTAINNPTLFLGWTTFGSLFSPTTSYPVTLFTPFALPCEYNNSRIPYQRSRLNSSAALFTNVTAVMSKEGTILAGRLKQSVVDPWSFSASNIDSIHPSLRYFGPLEKGLYTFTTPSGNLDNFDDFTYPMPQTNQTSASFITERPLFDYKNVGVYNAVILTDLGSSTTGTQLAVSQYSHVEFETTSSLFQLGVSTQTLESLHATEVALLRFGHFHENPLHWAALKAAASAAMRYAAPMLAPVVEHYGRKMIDKGVAYLRGKAAGDRKMQQASLAPKPPAPRPRRRAKQHQQKTKQKPRK